MDRSPSMFFLDDDTNYFEILRGETKMVYYMKELSCDKSSANTGGEKARDDFECIFDQLGFRALLINYGELARMDKLSRQIRIYQCLKAGFSTLRAGDVLFMQFPFQQTTVLLPLLIRYLRKKSVRYVILLHDLDSIRHGKRKSTSFMKRIKIKFTEVKTLKNASQIILHNPPMLQSLFDKGVRQDKLNTISVFDYLIPGFDPTQRKGKTEKDKPVIIAANLSAYKASYAYHLPANCNFNLYGVDFSGELPAGSRYFGSIPPGDLPHIMEGSFGLVWDGESAETCAGIFGEYMRLNCPHKISLYLASGIPVVIWRQAARAEFITQNRLGVAVDSLSELSEVIDRMSEEEYAEMAKNAERIGAQLRAGCNTRKVVKECLEALHEPMPIDWN